MKNKEKLLWIFIPLGYLFLVLLFVFYFYNNHQTKTDEIFSKTEQSSETTKLYDMTKIDRKAIPVAIRNISKNSNIYEGWKIRIKGICTTPTAEDDSAYHTIFVEDGTTCSSAGFEFEMADEAEYPNDFDEITIVGVLSTYEKDGETCCYLADAAIEKGGLWQ